MKNKKIGSIVIVIFLTTIIASVNASAIETSEQEPGVYESILIGIGLVRINSFTQRIWGFVVFGFNDGEIISMQFINIKYENANELFAGFIPGVFFIRYNPT